MPKSLAPRQYQDVRLTELMLEVDKSLRKVCAPDAQLTPIESQQLLKDVCQGIRKAKIHFAIVLDRYGSSYDDSGNKLIEMTYVAADKAGSLGFESLQHSIRRHAEDLEQARSAAIAHR